MLTCLTFAAIWITTRLSKKLIVPLSTATSKIREVSAFLSRSLEIGEEPSFPTDSGDISSEIRGLHQSIAMMEMAVKKTEELRRALDAEREKSYTTSKLAALGEMAGGVAHEINTPLAVVTMRTSQLLDILEDEPVDRALALTMVSNIESTTQRISSIINSLRSLSRDGSRDPFVPTEIHRLLTESAAYCTDKFERDGVRLILHPDDPVAEELRIECRSVQISQVILNLMNNAYDAIQSLHDRWIEIKLEDRGETIEISVTDSGQGIASEVADKMFQPFFTTKDVGKGTGLGLGISRKIAEIHGGELILDKNSPNTRFVLILPKVQYSTQKSA